MEIDVDVFETLAALCGRLPCVGATVATGEHDVVGEWGEQRPMVQSVDADDVHPDAKDDDDAGEVAEGDKAKNDSKVTVGGGAPSTTCLT